MSILQSIFLAVALAAGSFASTAALTPNGQTQAGQQTTSGPINCESPCRIDDPKCRCGGSQDGK
ncbi:MAG TPA: hypothetical protein VGN86_00160 [Pyrinomonadaceae bacterium]|nr:hypothetical protein [Pyrinomonadaceae bacterium]